MQHIWQTLGDLWEICYYTNLIFNLLVRRPQLQNLYLRSSWYSFAVSLEKANIKQKIFWPLHLFASGQTVVILTWKHTTFIFFKETCTSTNAGVHNTIDFKPPLANTSLKTPSRAKCVFFWNYHQSPGLTSQPFFSTEFTKFRVWDQRRKEKGSFGWSEGMESLVD